MFTLVLHYNLDAYNLATALTAGFFNIAIETARLHSFYGMTTVTPFGRRGNNRVLLGNQSNDKDPLCLLNSTLLLSHREMTINIYWRVSTDVVCVCLCVRDTRVNSRERRGCHDFETLLKYTPSATKEGQVNRVNDLQDSYLEACSGSKLILQECQCFSRSKSKCQLLQSSCLGVSGTVPRFGESVHLSRSCGGSASASCGGI